MEANRFLTYPLKQDVPRPSDLVLFLNRVSPFLFCSGKRYSLDCFIHHSNYKQQNLVYPPGSTVSTARTFRSAHLCHSFHQGVFYASNPERYLRFCHVTCTSQWDKWELFPSWSGTASKLTLDESVKFVHCS
jgi:hypothetical protein